MHCGKTADRIRMPFDVTGPTGPCRDDAGSGVWGSVQGKGTYGANLGAPL